MKILIVTQKIDSHDFILGFFHQWVAEFANHCEKITVICLEKGDYSLPHNVVVLSLGKESSVSRIKYIFNFYKYILTERKNYDVVFVHMNPEYVILGGIFWIFLKKKIFFWYTHKNVDFKLRIAEKFVDKIFTASAESFRLASTKLITVGHGIDVFKFSPGIRENNNLYTIISVGRISKTKRQYDMVLASKILKESGFSGQLILVGGAVTNDDRVYENEIREYVMVNKLDNYVVCIGPVSPGDIASWYKKADMFINLSETGSMDKAVLEAMSSGLHVITSNEAFKNILPANNFLDRDSLKAADIAKRITFLAERGVDASLREYVIKNHNLSVLIPKLINLMKS